MKKVGEVFFDRWDLEVGYMVYDSETKEIMPEYKTLVESYIEKNGNHYDLFVNTEYSSGRIEPEYEFFGDNNRFRSWSSIADAKNKAKQVIKILESVKGLDMNNMILHNGELYTGYDDCSDFIQTTYTWCSSSMEC